jgi:signal transduction histidine kinase
VRLSALRDGAAVQIAVRDTGVGISAEDLQRLGRPFEQVDAAHVKTQEGTGLGLALVKALAAMHAGEATIESKLGQGTTVRLRLPHAAVSADGVPLATDAQSPPVSLKGAA